MSGGRRPASPPRLLTVARARYELPEHFLSTAAISFMLVTGIHILSPVLPLYADRFGVSNLGIGMVVGGYAAGRFAFDIAGGVLADRFGTRATAAAGCAITFAASFVGGWTSSFEILLAARVLQGIGSALYVTATTGLIVALAPPARLGRLMALYQGIFMAGLAFGPVIGGVVAALFGLHSPFYAYGLMSLVGAVMSLAYLPDRDGPGGARPPVAEPRPDRRKRRELMGALLRERAMIIALTTTVAIFVARSGVRSTLLPLYAETAFGLTEVSVGVLLTVAAVANLAVLRRAGTALDAHGRRHVVRRGSLAMAGAIALYAVVVAPWMLFPVTALVGLATGYSGVAPAVVVADVADPRIRATAIGVQRMATDFGQLAGPLVVGALADAFGYRAGFLLAACVCAAFAAAAFTLPETMPRRDGGRRTGEEPDDRVA